MKAKTTKSAFAAMTLCVALAASAAEPTTSERIKEDAHEVGTVLEKGAVKAGHAIREGAVAVGNAAERGVKAVQKGAAKAKQKISGESKK